MRSPVRHPLLVTALAPLIPHILGSAFNIWYNMVVIDPLLRGAGLRPRFVETVILWNAIVYPIAGSVWVGLVLSLRPALRQLQANKTLPPSPLDVLQRRLVHLPWY